LFQIISISGEVYLQDANLVTAINGFRKYEIVVFNGNIFSEGDFLATEVTDQCQQTEKFTQKEKTETSTISISLYVCHLSN
jgi:hypothetical protein